MSSQRHPPYRIVWPGAGRVQGFRSTQAALDFALLDRRSYFEGFEIQDFYGQPVTGHAIAVVELIPTPSTRSTP